MKKKAGFTLVELMVVVAIIAVLVAILMPALGLARDLARKATCATRLGQFGKAIAGYVSTYQSYPHFAPSPLIPFQNKFAVVNPDGTTDSVRAAGFPKFYAVLEQMRFAPTHRTTWGVGAYLWEAEEIWEGAFCPAMDTAKILNWADDMADKGKHPQARVAMHRAACGYSWNPCLRAKVPQYWDDGLNQVMPGRWPAELIGQPGWFQLNATRWIDFLIVLPGGSTYAAQAVRPQEIDDMAHVAEAWDSCDFETAPNVDRDRPAVQNLLPGWHVGPQSRGTNGWAMLNGARHPVSPNILYAEGSVRADATKELTPADLGGPGSCPAGTWDGIKANSWWDWEGPPDGFGTMHHIVPRKKLWTSG